jgi:hypothetical protein
MLPIMTAKRRRAIAEQTFFTAGTQSTRLTIALMI